MSFKVEGLPSLARFLKGTMGVRVCLVRTMYTKEGVSLQGQAKPQSANHGRGTPQSGWSSATKVTAVPVKVTIH